MGDEDNNQVEVVSTQLVRIFHAWEHVFQVKCCLVRHHLSPLMVHYYTGEERNGCNTVATATTGFHPSVKRYIK
jgi:hypothetical protein